MSLFRSLRAYVGLGPDEDYDDLHLERGRSRRERADGDADQAPSTGRRRGYLDDIEPRNGTPANGDRSNRDVVDISNARIEARRADGTLDRNSSTNQSRNRTDDRSSRRDRLRLNEQLLDELTGDRSDASPNPVAGQARGYRGYAAYIDLSDGQVKAADSAQRDDDLDNDLDDGFDAVFDGEPAAGDTAKQDAGISPDSTAEGAVVRSIESARRRPRTVSPESFAEAKDVADEFKRETPIVLNLQGLERDLVRRLVDFASGLCYALDGSMEKLAPQVFMLVPDGVDVSADDRRRIEQRGYAR